MVIGLLCLRDISIKKVKSTDQRAFQTAVVVRLEKTARTCCRNSLLRERERERKQISIMRIIYIALNKLTTVATRVNLITNFAL